MTAEFQIGYYIIAALCMILSLFFQWRAATRNSVRSSIEYYEFVERVRTRLRSEIVNLLYHDLLSPRKLLWHLSIEERLKNELELMVRKPEIMRTLSALLNQLSEAEQLPLRLQRIHRIRTASAVTCILLGFGVSLPLLNEFLDNPVRYSLGNWIAFVAFVATLLILTIAVTMESRVQRRMNSVLHSATG